MTIFINKNCNDFIPEQDLRIFFKSLCPKNQEKITYTEFLSAFVGSYVSKPSLQEFKNQYDFLNHTDSPLNNAAKKFLHTPNNLKYSHMFKSPNPQPNGHSNNFYTPKNQ
jgi:hypothetical protein